MMMLKNNLTKYQINIKISLKALIAKKKMMSESFINRKCNYKIRLAYKIKRFSNS